jgi:hypothetical protein
VSNQFNLKIRIMKKSILLLALLVSAISYGQTSHSNWNDKDWEQVTGSGRLVRLNPAVTPFTTVEVALNVKLVIEAGGADHSLEVSIDDNLSKYFKFRQDGSTLKVYFDFGGSNRWLSSNSTVVTIKAPVIEQVVNSSNAEIDVSLPRQAAMKLVTSGNPNINLKGQVEKLVIDSRGNSDINASELFSTQVQVSSDGNAEIVVNTRELLENNIRGNNDIYNVFGRSGTEITQRNAPLPTVADEDMVNISFRNSSDLPFKATLIYYRPDRKGNATDMFTLRPSGLKRYRVPVGTRFYLANPEQVDLVMGGGKLEKGPLLLVKKEDDQGTFVINK